MGNGLRGEGSWWRAWGVVLIITTFVTLAYGSLCCGEESFHSGGTGNCDGCHGTPVYSEEGKLTEKAGTFSNISSAAANFTPMLRGSDASSTCLMCHEAPVGKMASQNHYIATNSTAMTAGSPPLQLTPAGDFGWLKKNYRWTASEGIGKVGEESSPGERHGHNIVAADFGYMTDTKNHTAPGGIYPANGLSCISCHDPHGNYRRYADGTISTSGMKALGTGSYNTSPLPTVTRPVGVYRLLAGKGYQPKNLPGVSAFIADPPVAVAPPSYNRAETVTNTRVAYGSGMSEWCQNCHGNIHAGGEPASLGHPAGNSAKLTPPVINNYNFYVASGNLNGNGDTSYTSLVPFEVGTTDYTALREVANSDGAYTRGPDAALGNPNVMCLTCHRAHASGWDSMTRWNMKAAFIVSNGRYPGVDNYESREYAQGRTSLESKKAYYDRPATSYASYQRGLCNKCHVKD